MKLFRKPLLAAGLIALAGIGFLGTGDAFAMNTTDNQPKKAVKIVQTAGGSSWGTLPPILPVIMTTSSLVKCGARTMSCPSKNGASSPCRPSSPKALLTVL